MTVNKNKHWIFFGDVLVDDRSHSRSITMETWAPSDKKALSNFKHRYRIAYDIPYGVEIEFWGDIKLKHEPKKEAEINEPEAEHDSDGSGECYTPRLFDV